MNEKHAFLSPSSSAIWTKCPHHLRLKWRYRKSYVESPSAVADRGTSLHAIMHAAMKNNPRGYEEAVEEVKNTSGLTGDQGGKGVLKAIKSLFNCGIDFTNSKVYLEKLMSSSVYVDECRSLFGTADMVVESANGDVSIVDYKFGRVEVDSYRNMQLMLYFYLYLSHRVMGGGDVKLIIIQPYVSPGISIFKIENRFIEVYKKYIDKKVIEAVHACHTTAGEAYNVGEHCTYCNYKTLCKHYSKDLFKEPPAKGELTIKQLEELFLMRSSHTRFFDELEGVLLRAGGELVKHEVVDRMGHLKWVSEEALSDKLGGIISMYDKVVKRPGGIRKEIGDQEWKDRNLENVTVRAVIGKKLLKKKKA